MADSERPRDSARVSEPIGSSLGASPAFPGRVAACFYAVGALLGASIALAPHSAQLNQGGFLAVSIASAVLALVLWLLAPRLPGWGLSVAAGAGTLLISFGTYFTGQMGGTLASDNELLYIWVVLFSAYFLPRRQVLVQITMIAIAYEIVLAELGADATFATRWLETVGTLVVVAVLVHVLRSRVSELVARLSDAARTDPLTGLFNRRCFEELLETELERTLRNGQPASLLLGDLDNFKQVNDHAGHAGGDAALVRIAEILQYWKRKADAIARTGGEEFAILLPNTTQEAAYGIAERLRGTVDRAFSHKDVPVTFSFGVATFPQHAPTARSLMLAADQALYAAKELGRNMSVVYSDQIASLVSTEVKQQREQAETQLQTVMSLAEALDLRDMGTAAHSKTVAGYCELVARELGLPETQVERVRTAGVLHDVGKIGLPDTILQKPGPLTDAEWEKVRQHPEIGAGILSSPSFDDIREWVLSHHERPDGKGYPRGLSGQEIPLEARIVAVADAYEAMTAHRPYREAMPHEVARTELLSRAGSGFDSRVVSALLAVLERQFETASRAAAERRSSPGRVA
jgi:diguanylate cyclase (GGDEF)-like protein/putative nucleotidyltransferase with HDIG domain